MHVCEEWICSAKIQEPERPPRQRLHHLSKLQRATGWKPTAYTAVSTRGEGRFASVLKLLSSHSRSYFSFAIPNLCYTTGHTSHRASRGSQLILRQKHRKRSRPRRFPKNTRTPTANKLSCRRDNDIYTFSLCCSSPCLCPCASTSPPNVGACSPAASRVDTLVQRWAGQARSAGQDPQRRSSHHAFILAPSLRGADHWCPKSFLPTGWPHVSQFFPLCRSPSLSLRETAEPVRGGRIACSPSFPVLCRYFFPARASSNICKFFWTAAGVTLRLVSLSPLLPVGSIWCDPARCCCLCVPLLTSLPFEMPPP